MFMMLKVLSFSALVLIKRGAQQPYYWVAIVWIKMGCSCCGGVHLKGCWKVVFVGTNVTFTVRRFDANIVN